MTPKYVPAALSSPPSPARELAKVQPCGCVVCTCEDEERCSGCGAKHCGTHPVGKIPNPVYAPAPPSPAHDERGATRDELLAGMTRIADLDPDALDAAEEAVEIAEAYLAPGDAPCPLGEDCPDARRYGHAHPAPAAPQTTADACHRESHVAGVLHVCNRTRGHAPPCVLELFKRAAPREPDDRVDAEARTISIATSCAVCGGSGFVATSMLDEAPCSWCRRAAPAPSSPQTTTASAETCPSVHPELGPCVEQGPAGHAHDHPQFHKNANGAIWSYDYPAAPAPTTPAAPGKEER